MDETHAKAIGKAAEGRYVLKPAPSPVEKDLPGVKLTNEVAEKYRGFKPEEVASHYRAGWLYISIFAEAIRLAMEKVGHENLTGRAVRDGFLTIKDFDMGVGPPVSISEERAYYGNTYFMQRVEKGKLVRISEWWKPRERFHYLPGGEMEVR